MCVYVCECVYVCVLSLSFFFLSLITFSQAAHNIYLQMSLASYSLVMCNDHELIVCGSERVRGWQQDVCFTLKSRVTSQLSSVAV